MGRDFRAGFECCAIFEEGIVVGCVSENMKLNCNVIFLKRICAMSK